MTISPSPEHLPQTLDAVDIARVADNPGQMLAMAILNKTDPETLGKLMALQERWSAARARTAYVEAMTAFKKEAPAVILKESEVDFTSSRGRTHYNYANLGDVVLQITALLSRHNLSVSWETDNSDQARGVTVTCHVTHSEGHRESVRLTAPPDESGNKNKIQSVGSTVTYLQRYTLLSALGLATADQDDDGREAGAPLSDRPQDAAVEPPRPRTPPAKAAKPAKPEPEKAATGSWAAWLEAEREKLATVAKATDTEAALTWLHKRKEQYPAKMPPDIAAQLDAAWTLARNALDLASGVFDGPPPSPVDPAKQAKQDEQLTLLESLLNMASAPAAVDKIAEQWARFPDVDAETRARGDETIALRRTAVGGGA